MIARVKNIVPKKARRDKNNAFGLKEGEEYQIIQTEAPEFVLGFEEEDLAIKNYA
jgi:hypothetical protein